MTNETQYSADKVENYNLKAMNSIDRDLTVLNTLESINDKYIKHYVKKKIRPSTVKSNLTFTGRSDSKLNESFIKSTFR